LETLDTIFRYDPDKAATLLGFLTDASENILDDHNKKQEWYRLGLSMMKNRVSYFRD